jgi:hypothetical protein
VFQPSRIETFSLVVAEAMGLSLPVVGTYCGGVEELVIPNETGLLVQAGDHTSAAKALCEVIEDREKRREFGKRGRQVYSEKCLPDLYARRISDLYQVLVSNAGQTGVAVTPAGIRKEDLEIIARLYADVFVLTAELNRTASNLPGWYSSRFRRITSVIRKIVGKGFRLCKSLFRKRPGSKIRKRDCEASDSLFMDRE